MVIGKTPDEISVIAEHTCGFRGELWLIGRYIELSANRMIEEIKQIEMFPNFCVQSGEVVHRRPSRKERHSQLAQDCATLTKSLDGVVQRSVSNRLRPVFSTVASVAVPGMPSDACLSQCAFV